MESILDAAYKNFVHISNSDLHPSQMCIAYRTFIHFHSLFHLQNRDVHTLSLSSSRRLQPQGFTPDFGYDVNGKKIFKVISDTSLLQSFSNDFL